MRITRRRGAIAGAAVALAVAVYMWFGPWASVERTGLTPGEFAARYDGLALPPSATDVSAYVQRGWGDEEIVVSFTVPDEQTYVDWATPLLGAPGVIDQSAVSTFDGGRLHVKRLHGCLSALRSERDNEYITYAIYDVAARRVYYQKAHRSRLDG